MNVQQEAVALFRFLEERGFDPSVRSIGKMLRAQKLGFRDADLRAWLKPFIERRDAAGPQAAAPGPHESLTGAAPGPQVAATGPRLRAHPKVSLVSNSRDSIESLPGIDVPTVRAKKARPDPKPEDLAAWAILEAAYPVVKEHVELAMTQADWKKQNKAAALSLQKVGKKPEQVAAALRCAYTNPEASRFYGNITRLEKLQEHWGALVAIAQGSKKPAVDSGIREYTGKQRLA